jgi:hypothetical protein
MGGGLRDDLGELAGILEGFLDHEGARRDLGLVSGLPNDVVEPSSDLLNVARRES